MNAGANTAEAAPVRVTFDARLEPHVRVHHAITGRTRLRLDPLRGRSDLLAALARRVAAREGVLSVRENASTASLLVEHDKAIQPEAIAEVARELWRAGLTGPARLSADAVVENWHASDATLALAAFQSTSGLTSEEAQRRIAQIGENRLHEPPPPPLVETIAAQFNSVPVALLAGSAVLSLATGGLIDALLTLGVIALNTGIGVTTEGWSANLVRRLSRPLDPDVLVRRDGQEQRAPASRIAPGDWIVLKPGVAVAADARLISADGLSVDESSLTGESAPVEKDAGAIVAPTAPLPSRRTMVYRGGVVTAGVGLAVATATGEATEMGRVRRLLENVRAPAPPMERALDRLGVRLTVACLGVSAAMALLLRARGATWTAVTKSAIALAVSAIPEGLPALAASTKAIAARTMARQGVFVRNVNIVETAANVDTLCLDKTGTLTEGRMYVAAVQTLDAAYDPGAIGLSPDLQMLAKVAALCNDARYVDDDGRGSGSGTELALIEFARRAGWNIDALRRENPRLGVRQRAQQRLYMATEHDGGDGVFLAVKGAPHQVLALCSTVRNNGVLAPLDESTRARLLAQNEMLANEGLRVLGFAFGAGRRLDDGEPHELEWLGLAGLSDPLRRGAAEMVRALQKAGLRTLILTGDQAGTARRLAAELGLASDGALDVVDASAIRHLPANELAELARQAEVFARVSPADKLAIIKALQADGHVVAMTGDGVNDGPALRVADLGIAMGKSGADVARNVADIVIADDDIGGLPAALARGRAADENLRRAVRFLLATNASEVALLLAESLHGPDALETPAQLFWLNLMTDVFPALGLAMARPSPDIMERAPRPHGEEIFGRRELFDIARDALRIGAPAMLTHVFSTARYGSGARTRGLTFLALASHQLMHALRLRPGRPASDLLDRPIELGVAAAYALLIAPFAIAPLRRVLRIAAPRPVEAALIVGFSMAPIAIRLLSPPPARY